MHSACRELQGIDMSQSEKRIARSGRVQKCALPLRTYLALRATLHTAGRILKLLWESGGVN